MKMLCTLTALVSALSIYAVVEHNLWSTAVVLWFAIHTVVFWALRRTLHKRPGVRKIRWIWAGLSIIAALVFVATLRPPLTSIVVTVSDVPATSQFELKTVAIVDNDREKIRDASRVHPSVSGRKKRDHAKFILIAPIKEDIQRLELRFGNHPYSWTLESLTVGTDFARIPVPVATWTGAEIANTRFIKPLMTDATPDQATGFSKLTTLKTERHRAKRPILRLNLSRAIVVKQADDSTYEVIRAAWFLLFVVSLLLAIQVPNIVIVVKRIASKIPVRLLLRYLNSTTRPTPE